MRFVKKFFFLKTLLIVSFFANHLSAKIIDIDSVNTEKISIQISVFKNKSNVQSTNKSLYDRDIFVKKMGSLYNVFVVNIEPKEKKYLLKMLKRKFPDAFVATKRLSNLLYKERLSANRENTNPIIKEKHLYSNQLDSHTILKTRKKFF